MPLPDEREPSRASELHCARRPPVARKVLVDRVHTCLRRDAHAVFTIARPWVAPLLWPDDTSLDTDRHSGRCACIESQPHFERDIVGEDAGRLLRGSALELLRRGTIQQLVTADLAVCTAAVCGLSVEKDDEQCRLGVEVSVDDCGRVQPRKRIPHTACRGEVDPTVEADDDRLAARHLLAPQ
eukprot:1990861-Prymnesium_polylepis.1